MKRLFATIVTLFALAAPALADVTVERFIRSGGLAGLGANETVAVEKISGLRKREATTTKLTGALGSFLGARAADIRNETITDVAKDAVWTLDHDAKSYSQSTLSAAREQSAAKSSEPNGTRRDEKKSDVKVVRNEVTVKETGQKKDLNGFPCVETVIIWVLETEDTESKERSKLVMTTDLWNTPDTAATQALVKEEGAFSQAYWKKAGADLSTEDRKNLGFAALGGMLGQDEKSLEAGMKDFRAKMEQVKGFAISTSIRWDVNPKEGDDAKASKKETAKKKRSDDDTPRGPGGFFGALRRAIREDVTGRSEDAPDDEQEQRSSSTVFDSYTEIRKITVAAVPGGEFQPPAGYKPAK